MTHEEKTRLIAEFDGWEYVGKYFTHEDRNGMYLHEMKYSYSYDWLMPVWHKFRALSIESVKDQFVKSEKNENIRFALINGNIEGLFNALAEAIEWYNTTKK